MFIYRGLGGNVLKTPRAYCATDHEDVSRVVEHIKAKHPLSPLTALGVSLGGIMLGNYLRKVYDWLFFGGHLFALCRLHTVKRPVELELYF